MGTNGNDIIVYKMVGQNWTAIAATRSDEVTVDGEVIPIASDNANDQGWTRNIAGRKSWSLNVSWLVTAVSDIEQVLLVGTRIKLHIGARGGYSGSSGGLTGFAIVKTAKATMTRGSLANGTFAFVGDGALE